MNASSSPAGAAALNPNHLWGLRCWSFFSTTFCTPMPVGPQVAQEASLPVGANALGEDGRHAPTGWGESCGKLCSISPYRPPAGG